ncbi:helix-turn-helix domain-containing protein [Patescibacteria group bacterium]|nr:helix-turn-helix domain-containing protein [Patescibacteria group bacterium]
MSKDLSTIARNIKKYRDKLGVSQDKLSKLAGVTLHTLTKIETGVTTDPRIETLKKIAKGLNVSVDDLIK